MSERGRSGRNLSFLYVHSSPSHASSGLISFDGSHESPRGERGPASSTSEKTHKRPKGPPVLPTLHQHFPGNTHTRAKPSRVRLATVLDCRSYATVGFSLADYEPRMRQGQVTPPFVCLSASVMKQSKAKKEGVERIDGAVLHRSSRMQGKLTVRKGSSAQKSKSKKSCGVADDSQAGLCAKACSLAIFGSSTGMQVHANLRDWRVTCGEIAAHCSIAASRLTFNSAHQKKVAEERRRWICEARFCFFGVFAFVGLKIMECQRHEVSCASCGDVRSGQHSCLRSEEGRPTLSPLRLVRRLPILKGCMLRTELR